MTTIWSDHPVHMCRGCITFAFNKETAHLLHMRRVSVAMINKRLSNAHMRFNNLWNRTSQETLLIKCLTCLKLRLGWGKNKVLSQGLNTLSLWSYQIVLLFSPSNLGQTLPLTIHKWNKPIQFYLITNKNLYKNTKLL